MRRHEVAALFIQASGGELTYAKIAAARELRLPVVMLTRPQPPAGASGSVPEAHGVARRRPRPQDVRVIGGVEPALG